MKQHYFQMSWTTEENSLKNNMGKSTASPEQRYMPEISPHVSLSVPPALYIPATCFCQWEQALHRFIRGLLRFHHFIRLCLRLWQRQWQWQTGGYQEGSLPWAAADTICVGQTPPHCSSTGSIFQLVHLCFFVQYPLCFLLLRSTVLNVLLERFFEILLKFWSAVCYWLWIILLWEVFLVCLQF